MEKSTHTKEYALVRAELKAAREAAQLSQRALASRLGIPHTWIAKVESGERRIDVVELCWYLAACGEQPPRKLAALGKKIVGANVRRHGHGGHSP
jgi:transcriptional regulator with XRE-family HTH domain